MSTRYCDGVELHIDPGPFGAGCQKIFYYDAIPERKPEESEDDYRIRTAPIRSFHDYLSTIDNWHVYEGDARYRRKRGFQQKKVDIMIAVDMLTHAFRGNMEHASLYASDLDFKPLLDALVQAGMHVNLMYTPEDTSRELRMAADQRTAMDFWRMRHFLRQNLREEFPDVVTSFVGQRQTPAPLYSIPPTGDDPRSNHLFHHEGAWILAVPSGHQWLEHSNTSYHLLRRYAEDRLDLALPEEPPSF